ncbi:MAG TPA: LutB/LldF family L-lactate oxidation iron-sulfur protein [Acidimicrobiales bacterium]|nr:LutB/LldF family L-lactate oxidation iron-sulfur protein [Acidimicrobiales bacterium]
MSTLRERARIAVANDELQVALERATDRFATQKVAGASTVANYEELREAARWVRAGVLARLPDVLGELADKLESRGVHVHWASDGADANAYILDVAQQCGAKVVVKSKSMASEEIHLNDTLGAAGIEAVETDLGEWIIQLARETPSHIILPAIHKTRKDIAAVLNQVAGGDLSDVPAELCAFARQQLRAKFMQAEVGISGVNFGVAETGSVVIITNEGNGRLVTSVPRTHIAVMGMERVLQTWEQFELMLALLPRAATGQQITTYVNALSGPRRPGEVDGPDEMHLVILDNGRSDILGTEFQEILHCIRCGACLNVCPVYRQIGGHGYGAVYSGPVGAVLTPLLSAAEEAGELQNASTLCGACWQACPVKIPLQDLLLGLRRKKAEEATSFSGERLAWQAWGTAWSKPGAYRATTGVAGAAAKVVPESWVPVRWREGRMAPRPRGTSFRHWMGGEGSGT